VSETSELGVYRVITDGVHLAAADVIRSDPATFSDAILGQPREEYLKTILKPNTWGGAIELLALATRYGAEIASIDVETGRVDTFAPPSGSQNRCIVLYSGIHYDAATLAPTADAPAEWHQTQFSAVSTYIS
jgi:ubiquitin thioesterase OTU1